MTHKTLNLISTGYAPVEADQVTPPGEEIIKVYWMTHRGAYKVFCTKCGTISIITEATWLKGGWIYGGVTPPERTVGVVISPYARLIETVCHCGARQEYRKRLLRIKQ